MNGSPATPLASSSFPANSAQLQTGPVGIYQVTFTVPSLPSGTPACSDTVRSNLTINFARLASSDGVGICVDTSGASASPSAGRRIRHLLKCEIGPQPFAPASVCRARRTPVNPTEDLILEIRFMRKSAVLLLCLLFWSCNSKRPNGTASRSEGQGGSVAVAASGQGGGKILGNDNPPCCFRSSRR